MAGERSLPGLGLTGFWNLGSNGWKTAMDDNLLRLSSLVQLLVLSRTTALPGAPTQGDTYIVPTGAAEHANEIAIYDNSAWVYFTPKKGLVATVSDENVLVWYSGTAWVSLPTGAEKPYDIGGTYIGSPTESQIILRYPVPRSVSFSAAMAGSKGVAAVAATADAVFSIRKNGVQFATMTFSAGQVSATFAGTASAFVAGDILSVVSPGTVDSTLSDIGFCLVGTRV